MGTPTGIIIFIAIGGFISLTVVAGFIFLVAKVLKSSSYMRRSINNLFSGPNGTISSGKEILSGNILERASRVDISKWGSWRRVLNSVSINTPIGYHFKDELVAIGKLILNYKYFDREGSSINGSFYLIDGAGILITAAIEFGIVTLYLNNQKYLVINLPERTVLNPNNQLVGKLEGNFFPGLSLGQVNWKFISNNQTFNIPQYRPKWSSINDLGGKDYEQFKQDTSGKTLLLFLKNYQADRTERSPIFDETVTFTSEEQSLCCILLATLFYSKYNRYENTTA